MTPVLHRPAATHNDLLRNAARLWHGPASPGLQVRLFRRRIICDAPPASVELWIAAESYYHLWVNGRYVTRGPIFHHGGWLPVARVDLGPHWRIGENVIAALVFTAGFPTHKVPTGRPGLWAALRVTDAGGRERWTVSDADWAVSDQVGWRRHTVRHGYALGPVEVLDAAAHAWGWESPDYDDAHWPRASVLPPSRHDPTPVEIDLPALAFDWAAAEHLIGAWSVGAEPAPLERGQSCELLGEWLQQEPWTPLVPSDGAAASWDRASGELRVRGLSPRRGVAAVLDFGRERVGNLCFNCTADTAGVVEVAWSEVLRDGRPEVTHKGTTYADRLLARGGTQRWDALQFTGLRYLVLILRGFTGEVRFTDIGVRTSTSVPRIHASFHGSDDRLNAIWKLCERTLRIATQETIIDCPSREQAPYLGDGHLVGKWLGLLNGDYRHWRYLIQLGFESQADDGLLRDAPLMPVRRSLIDYVLLTVVGVRDYVAATGDTQVGRQHLEGCRRAMGYFDRRLDATDLLTPSQVSGVRLEVEWDIAGPSRRTESLDPHLFIDHPGLGGHNVGEPGIERRGRNGALNALYALALRAMADLEEVVGSASHAAHRRATADRVCAAFAGSYWDAARGVFVDAVDADGRRFPQVSEQTNILAVMAGVPMPVPPRELLLRVLAADPAVCRCGPYFHAYLLPLMARLDLHAEALAIVRRRWGRMLDGGATSLWETFAGDCMDTWCHPWSAAPAPFLLREIVGLRINGRSAALALRPRCDLLPRAEGELPTWAGPVRLRWETHGNTVRLSGSHPESFEATLHPCDNGQPVRVTSPWQVEWAASRFPVTKEIA